jgi:hypothetical protein
VNTHPRIVGVLLGIAVFAAACGDDDEAASPAPPAAAEQTAAADDSALLAQLKVDEMFGWTDTHRSHDDVVRDPGEFMNTSAFQFVAPLEEERGTEILEDAGFVGGISAHYESPDHGPDNPDFAFAGVIEVRDDETASAEAERVIEASTGPCEWECVKDEQPMEYGDATVRGVRAVRAIRTRGTKESEIDRSIYVATWSVGPYVHLRFLTGSPKRDRAAEFVEAVEAEVERTRSL